MTRSRSMGFLAGLALAGLLASASPSASAQTSFAGDRAREDAPTPAKPTEGTPAAKPEEKKPDAKDTKKEKQDEWLAVLNGDVHTITNGELRGATVLCKNGRIHAIGYGLSIPKTAATIDAAGLEVYPGLIAVASNGVLGQEPVDLTTDVFSQNMTFALACGWTTMVTGSSAGKLCYGTLDGLLLRNNLWLRMNYASGDERRRIREELEKAREFLRKKKLFEQQKAAGAQVEEPKPEGVNDGYLKLLGGDLLARFDANDAEALRAIAKLAREFGFKAAIFGATEGWIVAEELGRAGVTCVVTPHTTRTFDRRLNRPNGATIENAALLHQGGVNVAVIPSSTRLSNDGLLDRDLRTPTVEAALAVRGGLPRDAAEAALTLNAARILGVDDRIGSLEPGKDADFIVLDGELLHYESLVCYSVVNGRLVYDRAKEPLFRDIRPRPSTYKEPEPEPEPKPEEPKPEEGEGKKEGEAKEGEPKPAEGEKKPDGDKPEGDKPKEEPKPGEPPKPESPPKPPDGPPKPDGG